MSNSKVYSAPQVAFYDAPEVLRDQAGLELDQKHHQAFELATDGERINPERRILGLQPLLFWLILIFIVIATAVGGGVGGSIASKSRSSDITAAPA